MWIWWMRSLPQWLMRQQRQRGEVSLLWPVKTFNVRFKTNLSQRPLSMSRSNWYQQLVISYVCNNTCYVSDPTPNSVSTCEDEGGDHYSVLCDKEANISCTLRELARDHYLSENFDFLCNIFNTYETTICTFQRSYFLR